MTTLYVELKAYGFRFFLEGSHESYFIKDNNGSFTFTVELDRNAKDVVDEKYENLGVNDLRQLLCQLVISPNEVLGLLGVQSEPVDKVVITYE